MTTLGVSVERYDTAPGEFQDYLIIANDIIYGGAAVGQVKASGHVRPLTSADLFAGWCLRKIDNTGGSAAAKTVRCTRRGMVRIPVTGAVVTDPVGTPVYATDDNTFSFSPVGGVFIGRLAAFISAGVIMLAYDVDNFVDPHAGWLAELCSANVTVDVEDTGKMFCVDTDAVVLTLSPVAALGRTKILNIAKYGTVSFSISPDGTGGFEDKVQGPDIAGTNDKDLILTKATSQRGDFVELNSGQADGAYVVRMQGIFTTEL